VSQQGRDTGLERDRALVSCDDGGGLVARQAALGMTALFSAPPALPVAQDTAPVAECSVGGADLAAWARDHGHSRRQFLAEPSGLRFAFYWRVSTEDHQDPVSSRQWQLDRASATISGAGRVVVEYCDVGLSRSVSPLLRPGMAALLSAVRDPGRDFDAVVIGSHERAFFGNQYSHIGLLLAEAGVQLWLPEVGGALDPSITHLDELMTLLGILARREVVRARARSKSARALRSARRAVGSAAGSPTGTAWSTPGRIRTRPTRAGAGACTASM